MIDKNFKRKNKCLCQNIEGLSEELEKLGYHRRGNSRADGIIVYPETNEYEELPYSEIEWKEGWMDYYCCQNRFLERAAEKYYDPEFREGLDRFSIVYPYWTDLNYSEDPKDWEEDLKEHLNPEWLDRPLITDLMMNPSYKEYIGFGLECNSIEDVDILSKYFWDQGFTFQFREVPDHSSDKLQTSRVWFIPSPEGPKLENESEDLFYRDTVYLYLCDIKYSDYPKLRKAILGLWKIGFLFKYEKNCYY